MELTRRDACRLAAAAASLAALGAPALAAAERVAVLAFTGGVEPAMGGVTLDLPEIAEDGATVPVTVSAPGAEAIMLLAPGNPEPAPATFRFGPLAAASAVSTRIRLAQDQQVIAVARLPGGGYGMDRRAVRVIAGGCFGPVPAP